jgi:putative tricarboxylic transport membrane protein
MSLFGILGCVPRKLDIPTIPVILGILLGSNRERARVVL